MRTLLALGYATSLLIVAAPAHAQPGSAIAIDQIPARSVAGSVGVAPVGGTSSSALARENVGVPTLAPEVIEACRAAQAEDRPAPDGVDCVAALQSLAEPAAPETAEGQLLNLFGFSGNLSGEPTSQPLDATSADAAARQLATGNADSGAAAAIARQQAAPPPTSPR